MVDLSRLHQSEEKQETIRENIRGTSLISRVYYIGGDASALTVGLRAQTMEVELQAGLLHKTNPSDEPVEL